MIEERRNFFIITGCSGGGKSTIIEGLRARGYECVDEAGRSIVREQTRIGADGTPWQDREKFVELLLSRYIFLYEHVAERNKPVFFDRGIPDLAVSSDLRGGAAPEHRLVAARLYRYARTVFFVPPWKEIFRTDAERKHSFEDAAAEYKLHLNVYPEYGYETIEIPKAPVDARVEFVIRHALDVLTNS